jgi:chemosensory pili system protein ChpA (sensor histidine kinase/response regulator)
MVFRSAGQLFAIPMQSVRSFGESERAGVCLSFSEILGCPPAETSQHIVLACESPSASGSDENSSVTLVVDEVIGPEEVVVRPLPTLLRQHPFCSGATLSGMGRTVLFLDARRLVETRLRDMERGDSKVSQTLVASNAGSPKGVRRSRVLVVDDSLSARKRVVRSLRRYQVDITEACDGKQALELLKKQRFDAIFSDMEMPHVDGLELLREVNSPDRQNPPPVVIISSRNEDPFTSRAKELGAVNYLIKPLADEALDRAISGIPSLSHLETESSIPLQMSGETHDR